MSKVIVIGGGILGASTAYHLAKAGEDVTIVDRFDKGQATDAAAGIVCPWLSQRRNKAWYELVKGGAKYYPTLIKQLEADGEMDTGYKQVGAICLHTEKDKLEKMAERARKRRKDAPEIGDIMILSPEETKKLFPPLAEEYGSVFVSGGARVNGRKVRNALLNGARKNGATFIKGDAKLIHNGYKINGVQVKEERLRADQVIDTGGAWSKQLYEPLDLFFPVSPQKAQIVHLEVFNKSTGNWPVVMPPNNQYILSFEDDRVVVGATHEDDVGFDHRVTAGGINEILEKAMGVAPGLSESTLLETRVGFRPFTPGFLPIFGPLPGYEGIFVANGLGASGLTSGPYLGAELTKLVLGRETELTLKNYDVSQALQSVEGG
ncbi:D-amino-acid dehydrogenase [Salirhabdus euzebyi]|uniref:D-amino-acid dehydrogenase n=1 Tax=Salirhabdus euzebyi TaxID=394506 RepID=A0A841Q9K1_9BACI|nr:FAD-dependent oxidoreductase [Salirhabdus euzebyi]MBB6454922.1 D-amino-acid dehydrogenase [Salirhabdus euzebyi]